MHGKECKLTEPIYGTQFDLNKLHSELNLKVGGNGQDVIEFNVCGNLNKVCAGAKAGQVAACFNKNGRELKFGKLFSYFSIHHIIHVCEILS